LDGLTFPMPPDSLPPGSVRDIEIAVEERLIEVGSGAHVEAWTYNGTARRTRGNGMVRCHLTRWVDRPVDPNGSACRFIE
ncbi:MAG: hypothetical protein ACRDXF_06700, partial [Acidimicrobiia bacterium]